MLMKLGPVKFEIYPVSIHGYDHSHETPFAEKAIVGGPVALEWVGEGSETWTLSAKLYPAKFGGLDALTTLYQARLSGRPQYLVRGDGKAMGWVVVTRVTEKSTYLDAGGVGQVIEVDIGVTRSGKPSDGSFFSVMGGAAAGVTGFISSAVSSVVGR